MAFTGNPSSSPSCLGLGGQADLIKACFAEQLFLSPVSCWQPPSKPVGGSDDEDALLRAHTIHFREDLIDDSVPWKPHGDSRTKRN